MMADTLSALAEHQPAHKPWQKHAKQQEKHENNDERGSVHAMR
jgi:hypothetical protein